MQILNLTVGQKMVSVQKSPILRPLYNRYFCHIHYYKVVSDLPKFHQKVLFEDIFLKDIFSIKFNIKAVWALHQGKGHVKNGFQTDFVGPYGIPHGYKSQAEKLLDLKFICTTILYYSTDSRLASFASKPHEICSLSNQPIVRVTESMNIEQFKKMQTIKILIN